MAEHDDLQMQKEKQNQKEVAFYSAIVQAWIGTRMEADKSLLALSGGAIALIVTLLTTVGASNTAQYVEAIVAAILFIVTIICVLWIFEENAEYLAEQMKDSKKSVDLQGKLACLDTVAKWSFLLGICAALVFSIHVSIHSVNKQEKQKMSNENSNEKNDMSGIKKQGSLQGIRTLQESLQGVQNMSPQEKGPDTLSMQGINSLNPTMQNQTGQQGQSSTPKGGSGEGTGGGGAKK